MHTRCALQHLRVVVRCVTVFLIWTVGAALSAEKESSPYQVLKEDSRFIVIAFTLPAYTLDTVEISEGIKAIQIHSVGEIFPAHRIAGAPMAQEMVALLALPSRTSRWKLRVDSIQEQWSNLPLLPYPAGDRDTGTLGVQFSLDQCKYSYHTLSTVRLEYVGISRGIPLGRLSIPVIDYDPKRKSTRILERCIIRIEFFGQPEGWADIEQSAPVLNVRQLHLWQRETKATRLLRRKTPPLPFISGMPIVKITVAEEGIYAITAEQLASIGVRIPPDLVHTIKVFGYGGQPLSELPTDGMSNTPVEQPIIVETNTDGSLRAVLLYAAPPRGFLFDTALGRWRRYINPYTTKTSYLLTYGGAPGLRYEADPPPSQTPTVIPQFFLQRLLFEEERVNAYSSCSGRRWLGDPFDGSTGITFTAPLPGLAMNGTHVEYTLCFAHRDDAGAAVAVQEHGVPVRSLSIPGKAAGRYVEYISLVDTVRVPISLFSDGRMGLRLLYRNQLNAAATGIVDYVEVCYPAHFVAHSNSLHLYTEPTDRGVVEFSVSGFSSRPLCLDITDPVRPRLLTNLSSVNQQATFRVVLDSTQAKRPRQYYVSAERRRPELSIVQIGEARNVELSADLVVITPLEFFNSARAFAEYRAAHSGIQVIVMPLEHIYTAFAAGMPDPTALRDFLSYAYFNWQRRPRYVLLWGDGHCDYRGIAATAPNWIPPYENDNVETALGRVYYWSYADDSYVTDDYFVWVDGNDQILDLAIGRMPVTSEAMGMQLLSKIKAYEMQSSRDAWQTTVTLVADDGPTSGGRTDGALHVNSSETLSAVLSARLPALIQRKVYMPEFPLSSASGGNRKPAATEAMLSIINGQGTLFLNWMGHGNPRVWAHEEIFDRDRTISLLRNERKNFFLIAATCDFSRFDMPDVQSGGELLVQWPSGGAIGVFSAARVVYTFANEAINRRFYEEVAKRNADGRRRTLGDVMFAVKQVSFSDNDRRYLLLGDPSLRLLLPDLLVTVDSVEQSPVVEHSITSVCALSRIRIVATVRDPLSLSPLENFNGMAIVSLFDPDVFLRLQDQSALAMIGDATVFQFWKMGGMLHRGTYTVSAGRLIAEFIIPKDVTLSDSSCRIHLFAYNTSNYLDGMGVSRAVRINCVNATSVEDRTGPQIAIWLDSRRFRPGDIVRRNPIVIVDLWDESGINTAGIGIGHKIEAWLDDNLDAIDLTEFFETLPTDSRGGTVKKQLFDLAPGIHTLRVRAWDVWNNYSQAVTSFVVAPNDSIIQTGWVTVYPHPFSQQVTITYNHNQSAPVNVRLTITQLDGRTVWQTEAISNQVHNASFVWDGRSLDGQSLSAGVYCYTLELENPYGSHRVIRGLLVKIQ
ncbi:MAG: type IX secretion system sortase PorU [Candidatus Kapabacteria bacterium]|nr:type IX secretion system sortase PorU [Candidatus Kapabacteria bacterium]